MNCNKIHTLLFIIKDYGLPGWTTQQMIQGLYGANGLATILQQQAPIHVVILLAGTKDVAFTPSNNEILQNLMALYDVCVKAHVNHIFAIGIPPSAYQAHFLAKAAQVVDLNLQIAQFCASQHEQFTFVPFPIDTWNPNDDQWAPDGLHFAPKGYQVLGESLAPSVQNAIVSLL